MIDLSILYKYANNQVNRSKDKRRYSENMRSAIELKLELFDGEMDLKKFISRLAAELDLPKEYVYRVYVSAFESLDYVISSYPDPIPLDEDEFNALPFHKFAIPHLGYLTMSHLKYKKKKVKKIVRNLKDEEEKEKLSALVRRSGDTDTLKDHMYREIQDKRSKGEIIDYEEYRKKLTEHNPYSPEEYEKTLEEVINKHIEILPEFKTNKTKENESRK